MTNEMKIKKLFKNKKAGEGEERSLVEIIGWVIVIALVVFALLWYSGLGTKIIAIGNYFLK